MAKLTAKYNTIFTVVPLVTLSLLAVYISAQNQGIIEAYIVSAGPYAFLVVLAFYALLALTPLTSDFLTILCGALYGPVVGFFISWLGNTLAALVEYAASRGVAHAVNFEDHKKKLPAWLARLPADSWGFLIGGRFVPGFGAKMVSIVSGAYKVPVWKYVAAAAIANVFGSMLYAFGGAELFRLFTQI